MIHLVNVEDQKSAGKSIHLAMPENWYVKYDIRKNIH